MGEFRTPHASILTWTVGNNPPPIPIPNTEEVVIPEIVAETAPVPVLIPEPIEPVTLPVEEPKLLEPTKDISVKEKPNYRFWLTALSAASIALTAAYFSIYGLCKLFSWVAASIAVMGVVLEVGKFTAASYCHGAMKDKSVHWALKTFLMYAIVVLMVLTSVGIYGYLSNAYQHSSLDLEKNQIRIGFLEERKKSLMEQKKIMDDTVASSPANFVNGKIKMLKQLQPEQDRVQAELQKVYSELDKVKLDNATTGVDVGPIIFIAKALNKPIDKVVTWIIILFVSVFDPLAVALVLALNYMARKKD